MFNTLVRNTSPLLRNAYSINSIRKLTSVTFFTKDTCKLCSDAKQILESSLNNPTVENDHLQVKYIDIMDPNNQEWFDKYCYDVPVLHIEQQGQKLQKFMHYFNEKELVHVLANSK
ncbi:hypothetical protein PVL30_002120 [Lodderomyces elongisporus]|uniref:uncharacterized protein n=1 Tax=Lodderomyces elongisporus TaxID=36914 RepID=UPI00291CA9B2|nr:uncharacterized protein PVL30_002120 [Lodderomyces elongisporus]WLF78382.1 hypothetical protein PVL30_002120 [Lodderomyces elongisporus]